MVWYLSVRYLETDQVFIAAHFSPSTLSWQKAKLLSFLHTPELCLPLNLSKHWKMEHVPSELASLGNWLTTAGPFPLRPYWSFLLFLPTLPLKLSIKLLLIPLYPVKAKAFSTLIFSSTDFWNRSILYCNSLSSEVSPYLCLDSFLFHRTQRREPKLRWKEERDITEDFQERIWEHCQNKETLTRPM